jgi:hypothetical protein
LVCDASCELLPLTPAGVTVRLPMFGVP